MRKAAARIYGSSISAANVARMLALAERDLRLLEAEDIQEINLLCRAALQVLEERADPRAAAGAAAEATEVATEALLAWIRGDVAAVTVTRRGCLYER